jgi:cell division control protein 45
MILEIDDWHLGYDQMVKDTRGSSVWILCNADVDSLAAARILTYMLRADSVSYQLRPCWSYTQLISVLQEPEATDMKALVLLNLGANRNLTRLFEYLTADTKVYVMDCRKPVHLANVHAGPNVVVFWDNGQDQIPSDGDNLSGNESTTDEEQSSLSEQESDDEDDSDDDQDPDEGEAEFDDEDDLVKRKEKAVEQEDPDYYGEDEDDDDDNEDEDEGTKKRIADTDDLTSSKRRKKDGPDDDDQDTDGEEASPEKDVPLEQQQPTMTPRELHRDRRNRLRAYYSEGSYYGSPVAWVAYRLATQKRWPDQGDLLWLACVGLTDAYIHGRIDKAGYVELSVDLKTQCLRVFPNDMIDRIDKTIYAESLRNQTGGSQTQVTISESGKVLAESDYRFFLLRHSSLYDSMMYSNYVATRLQVWTNAGKQSLDELLAKMGFPLDECKQPYAFMNPHLKRKLRTKLDEFAEVSSAKSRLEGVPLK